MGAALGHDLSHVEVHTDTAAQQAAEALNAQAFALGADLFFAEGMYQPGSASGDALLAHELTHVVQHDEGRLPTAPGGDVAVSNPTESAEREADAAAIEATQALAAQDSVGDLGVGSELGLESSGVASSDSSVTALAESGVAMRKVRASGQGNHSAEESPANKDSRGPEKPKKVELSLGGVKVTVELSTGGEELEQTIDMEVEPVKGVKITKAKLTFNKRWDITSGQLEGTLSVGEVLVDSPIKLAVKPNKQVEATIKDVHIPLGDLLKGKMDLKINEEGVTGKATFTHDMIDVGPQFQLTSGKLKVELDPEGQFKAEGNLVGKAAGIGTFTLKSRMDNNALAGQLEVKLDKPVDLGANVKLTGGGVAGEYKRDAESVLNGSINLDLAGYATGTVTAAWTIPPVAAGEGQGGQQTDQVAPGGGEQGELTSNGADATTQTGGRGDVGGPAGGGQNAQRPAPAPNPANAPAPSPNAGPDQAPREEAVLAGDVAQGEQQGQGQGQGQGQQGGGGPIILTPPGGGKWCLQGTTTVTKAIPVAEGITLDSGEMTVNVTDNVLQPVQAKAKLSLPDQIQAELDGTFDVAGKTFSGAATLSSDLARPVGDTGLTITSVTGTGTFVQNVLTQVKVNAKGKLERPDSPKFEIELIDAIYDVQTKEISGQGKATLVSEEELGKQGVYTLFMTPETSATATVEKNNLTTVDGDFKLALREGANPFVKAQINTTLPMETGKLSGTATATLEADKQLGTAGSEQLWLAKGGELTATLQEDVLTDISGGLTLSIRDTEGEWVTVGVTGKVDLQGEEGFTGEGTTTVTRAKKLLGGESAYGLYVSTDTTATAKVEANKLQEIGGTVKLDVKEGEEDFVKAEAEGKYLAEAGKFSGNGKATVVKEKKLGAVGKEEIWLGEGGELRAAVAENALSELAGKVALSVRDPEEWVKVEVEGSVDPTGKDGFSGTGKASVMREKRLLGEEGSKYSFWLDKGEGAGATGHFEASKLTKIDGNVPFAVKDTEPEALIKGAVAGTYTPEAKEFTGTGSMALGRDVDVGEGKAKIRVQSGSGGTGTVDKNRVTEVNGTIKGQVLIEENPEVEFSGSGKYNVVEGKLVEATVQAKLLRMLEPFGKDVVQISDLTGTAKIENNEVKEITGGAKIKMPKMQGTEGQFQITWKKEGDKDSVSGSGKLHVVLFKGGKNGRSAEGDVTLNFDGSDKFNAKGDIQYQITKNIGGKIGVEIDEKMDPLVSGELALNSELIPAGDLFRKKFDILPEQSINLAAGPVPIVFKFGAAAGFGLGMNALALSSKIGISDWRPLSEQSQVPNFDASAQLNWGLNFDAMAAAWLSLGLGVSIASAGAGMRGEAKLDVPLTTAVDVNLHGGQEGFWGDMGIALGLKANLSFRAIPFLYANLFSKKWEHDFDGFTWDLGEIAKFDWGSRYEFGDKRGVSAQAPKPVSTPAPTKVETKHEKKPAIPESSTKAPKTSPEGPDLSGVSSLIGGKEPGEQKPGGMEEKMALIGDAAKGIGAISYLMEQFGDLLTWAAAAGPIGLAIRLVWKMITGEITWSKLSKAVKDAIAGIRAIWKLIQPYLPTWWQKLQELIDRGINLLDEWWNGDTRMYEAVQKGEHRYADAGMWSEMVYRMLDFWSQDSHKRASLTVLEHSGGQIGKAMSKVGLDTCKSKFGDSMFTPSDITSRWKKLCVNTGYGKYVQKTDFWGSPYTEFQYTR
jgi:hypothetical protein